MFSLWAQKADTFINDTTYYWQICTLVISHRILTGWNPLQILDMLKKKRLYIYIYIYKSRIATWISSPEWQRRRRLWQSIEGRGFRWIWGRGTELPLCVSPRTALQNDSAMLCSHDKDKLHPLENVFSFFSFPPPSALSRLLHTSFFMPLGVAQMCATLKGDDEGGVVLSENILEGNLAPHRSQVSHCILWGNVLTAARFIHVRANSPPSKQPETATQLFLST